MSVSLLPVEPPLDPTRDQARQWAREELSDPVYAQAEPGLLERALRWLMDKLSELEVPAQLVPGSRLGLLLLLLLVALVAALVLVRTGRLRIRQARSAGTGVFDDVHRTAAEHRALAHAAAQAADWHTAVRERFRAVVRDLEERTVLDERPGRTAHEAAQEAGQVLPEVAAELTRGSLVFDDVCYGGRRARPEHDAQLRELDQHVRRATPRWDAEAQQTDRVGAGAVDGRGGQ